MRGYIWLTGYVETSEDLESLKHLANSYDGRVKVRCDTKVETAK